MDTALEMNYNTQSVISPAVLAAIAPFRLLGFLLCVLTCGVLIVFTVKRTMMSLGFVDKLLTVVSPNLPFYTDPNLFFSTSEEGIKVIKAVQVSAMS